MHDDCFCCISLTADGPQHVRLPISPTATLPSCMWSQSIFRSLPGSRLMILYRDASSALLQLAKQWWNFAYSISHAFRYGKTRMQILVFSRIELMTSALVNARGYLLDHSRDDVSVQYDGRFLPEILPWGTQLKKTCGLCILYCCCYFSHSAYWLPTQKTTLHGSRSRSWSAEQGKENKKRKSTSIPPPRYSHGENKIKTRHRARTRKRTKITDVQKGITGRIYMRRRSSGLGSSRARTGFLRLAD